MKAHRTDPVSLTFALIFLMIAAWWLVAKLLDLTVPDAGWFVAGLLIVVGVLGLLGALRAGRASAAPATAPPADPAAGHAAEPAADDATDMAAPTPVPPHLSPTGPAARDRAADPPA